MNTFALRYGTIDLCTKKVSRLLNKTQTIKFRLYSKNFQILFECFKVNNATGKKCLCFCVVECMYEFGERAERSKRQLFKDEYSDEDSSS